MASDFENRFWSFIENWNNIIRERKEKYFPNTEHESLTVKKGRKYMKVIKGTSVMAFVNIENGDIFMPASWKTPAKHARGNIFSDQNGLEAIGNSPTGCIRYLKG